MTLPRPAATIPFGGIIDSIEPEREIAAVAIKHHLYGCRSELLQPAFNCCARK